MMKKFKKGLRFQIFWKSALSMLVFFAIIMMVTTQVLVGVIRNADDNTSLAAAINLQSELSDKITAYKDSDINPNFGVDLYETIEYYMMQCAVKGIYTSAALLDSKYNIIAQTGNMMNVEINYNMDRKVILLDKSLTKDQIEDLSIRLSKPNQKGYMSGIINGSELIPQNITLVGEDGDVIYNIKVNANDTISGQVITTPVHLLSGSGLFEIVSPNFIMDAKSEKIFDECHSSLLNILHKAGIDNNLNGGGGSSSNSYGYSDGGFEIRAGADTYYIIYSSRYYPLDYAASLLKTVYIAGAIAALILLIILSSVLSRGIAKPILKLKDYAVRMASGERYVSYTLDSNRSDEITSLSESLAQMSENLSSAMAKLEEDFERERKMETQRRVLTGAIAHELKTPLGIIHSYAEGLKEKIAEDKKEHYLDVIMDETERMDTLILEMLDLSKLESSAYQVNPEQMNLSALTVNVLKRFEKNISDKGIILEINSPENVFINADPHRMEQVITNFVTNAIRHTPQGRKISVSISSDENHALFEIINEGEHIPGDQLKKIWDTFYKVDISRDRSKGGTGLGLAIAGSILNLHHARYGTENVENGVRFWFEIIM